MISESFLRNLTLLTATSLLMGVANAASPLATAGSSSSFEIRGHMLNVAGVPSWPILDGDDVASGGSPVQISFRDGSRITLAPNSRLRIESLEGGASANLTSGTMQFGLVSQSGLRILNNRVPVLGRTGIISIGVGGGSSAVKPLLVRLPSPTPPPVSGR